MTTPATARANPPVPIRVWQVRALLLALLLTAMPLIASGTPASAQAAGGTITGQVRSGGSTLTGICVGLHEAGSPLPREQTTTDGTGRFTFSGVDAGTYRLKFQDCVDGVYAIEWYEDAPGFIDATVITLGAGQSVTADAELARGGAVVGRVLRGDTGGALPNACVLVADPEHPSIAATARTGGDGVFRVSGLPAGSYNAKVSDCNSPVVYAQEWYQDARSPATATAITVTANSDTDAGNISLAIAGAISGAVTSTPIPGPLTGICVLATDLDAPLANLQSRSASDGAYSLEGLPAGRYRVGFFDCRDTPERAYEYWTTSGGTRNPADAGTVTVASAARTNGINGDLKAAGSIRGRVTVQDDPAALGSSSGSRAAAEICIAAYVPGNRDDVVAGTQTEDDGSYVLAGLGAGPYRISATDCSALRPLGLEYYQDQVLFGVGRDVAVTAGRATSNIDLVLGDIVRRAQGPDRIETAARLSQVSFETSDTVVIARSDAYPDALAGAPLARRNVAPILLTPPTSLATATEAEVRRLGATRALLLGGEAALGPEVVAGLRNAGVTDVQRVGGQNRFGTAALIAGLLDGGGRAYVVEGVNANPQRGWPDAVSVAGLAAFSEVPLLLVARDTLPPETAKALDDNNIENATIAGGVNAVSADVETAIEGRVSNVTRVFGSSRYDTSVAVAGIARDAGMNVQRMWIATGNNYPDALVAGPVVGADGGLLLLAHGDDFLNGSPAVGTFLTDNRNLIHRVLLLGGKAAIAVSVEQNIRDAISLG